MTNPFSADEDAPGAGAPRAERPRIVVAEDESLIRLDLVEMLEAGGYEVVAAVGNGQGAVDAVREHRPDVAVFDVKMPVKDGITAAEEVNAEALAPVLLLTAFSDRHLVERGADAGVMGYVVKPFTWSDLGPALAVALGRWREVRTLGQELEQMRTRFEARKTLDRAKGLLTSRLGLDEQAAFRWIQKTAMDRRLSMQQVCEGVIAEFGDA